MSVALIPMDFDGHEVAYFVDEDGNPWWPAKAPCLLLGHEASNVGHILDRLDADEKRKFVTTSAKSASRLARPQAQWCVNEAGLYTLILWSYKPEAKRFKRWITHDVLPAIRRSGRYSLTDREKIATFLSPTPCSRGHGTIRRISRQSPQYQRHMEGGSLLTP